MRVNLKVLETVGRCIYCGTSEVKLRNEHIVPYALNGKWQLLKASCPRCAEITSAFERDVCRTTLLVPRLLLGMRTRHKKRRPRTFPITILLDGKTHVIQVPPEQHYISMFLPIFVPPAYLSHAPYDMGIGLIGADLRLRGLTFPELDAKYGKGKWRFRIEYGEVVAFARMIAKIGYGFAVPHVGGVDGFDEVYVLPAILGKKDDVGRWVGCVGGKPRNVERGLHAIWTSIVGNEVHAFVRLFMQFDAPEYVVVVGRATNEALSAMRSR